MTYPAVVLPPSVIIPVLIGSALLLSRTAKLRLSHYSISHLNVLKPTQLLPVMTCLYFPIGIPADKLHPENICLLPGYHVSNSRD